MRDKSKMILLCVLQDGHIEDIRAWVMDEANARDARELFAQTIARWRPGISYAEAMEFADLGSYDSDNGQVVQLKTVAQEKT